MFKKLDTKVYNIFITAPNSDKGSDKILKMIDKAKFKKFLLYKKFYKYYFHS